MEWVDIAQIALTSGVVSALVSGAISYFSGRRLEEERRVYERIQEVYFDEGISHILTAISEYGTSTVFAFVDLNLWAKRSQNTSNKRQMLEPKIREIRERKSVSELITRDLNLATKWFPKLQRFGMPLYGAVKRTFQIYGRVLADTLDEKHLIAQIENDILKFSDGLTAVTGILQLTQIYLERRLAGIDDYIWKRKYSTYTDFLKVTSETRYQKLLAELEEYRETLDAWVESLTSRKPEDRKKTSLSLSKWLKKHSNANPLLS